MDLYSIFSKRSWSDSDLMVFLRILPQEAICTTGTIASKRRFGPFIFTALVDFER